MAQSGRLGSARPDPDSARRRPQDLFRRAIVESVINGRASRPDSSIRILKEEAYCEPGNDTQPNEWADLISIAAGKRRTHVALFDLPEVGELGSKIEPRRHVAEMVVVLRSLRKSCCVGPGWRSRRRSADRWQLRCGTERSRIGAEPFRDLPCGVAGRTSFAPINAANLARAI